VGGVPREQARAEAETARLGGAHATRLRGGFAGAAQQGGASLAAFDADVVAVGGGVCEHPVLVGELFGEDPESQLGPQRRAQRRA
jgi:hypothetical protein